MAAQIAASLLEKARLKRRFREDDPTVVVQAPPARPRAVPIATPAGGASAAVEEAASAPAATLSERRSAHVEGVLRRQTVVRRRRAAFFVAREGQQRAAAADASGGAPAAATSGVEESDDASVWAAVGQHAGTRQSFALQREAFACIDRAYLARGARVRGAALKVVSTETGPGGVRRFAVVHPAELWRGVCATAPERRHEYEILREDTPVHLYFDVDAPRARCVGGGGGCRAPLDAAVAYLLWRTSRALVARYGVAPLRARDVVHLESSSATKFSRHLVLRLRCGARFRDTAHAGAFVVELIQELAAERAMARAGGGAQAQRLAAAADALSGGGPLGGTVDWGALTAGDWDVLEGRVPPPPLLLPRAEDLVTSMGAAVGGEEACVVDTAVYTRNRAMRCYLSRKHGKDAVLYPAACNAHLVERDAEGGDDADAPLQLSYWRRYARKGAVATRASAGAALGEGADAPGSLDAVAASAGDASGGWARPLVRGGTPEWEQRFFQAALITDVLPPLWVSRVLALRSARGGAGAGAGAAAAAGEAAAAWVPRTAGCDASLVAGAAAPAASTCAGAVAPPAGPNDAAMAALVAGAAQEARERRDRASYAPETHPTHGFRLLYARKPQPLPRLEPGAPCSPAAAGAVSQRPVYVDGAGSPVPFPALAVWLLARASEPLGVGSGGRYAAPVATLRSWSATVAGSGGEAGGGVRDGVSCSAPADGSGGAVLAAARRFASFTVQVGGTRWCQRIGRQHKGNHVFWVVALDAGEARQGCHDPECRGWRSAPVQVPRELCA